MEMGRWKLVVAIVAVFGWSDESFGVQHMVGGNESQWTIPPHNDFYTHWSSSQLFQPGDTLLFKFDPAFYNVMQISKREYDDCTANQPYRAFTDSPLIIPLMEPGVFYYLCSILNYCSLGQKFNITVQPPTSLPPPPPPENSPTPMNI